MEEKRDENRSCVTIEFLLSLSHYPSLHVPPHNNSKHLQFQSYLIIFSFDFAFQPPGARECQENSDLAQNVWEYAKSPSLVKGRNYVHTVLIIIQKIIDWVHHSF